MENLWLRNFQNIKKSSKRNWNTTIFELIKNKRLLQKILKYRLKVHFCVKVKEDYAMNFGKVN